LFETTKAFIKNFI